MFAKSLGRASIYLGLLMGFVTTVQAAPSVDDLIAKKKYPQAEYQLNRLAQQSRTKPEQYVAYKLRLARLYITMNKAAKAIKTVQALPKTVMERSDARLVQGLAMYNLKRHKDATQLLSLVTGDEDVLTDADAKYHLALVEFDKEAYEYCIDYCQKVINLRAPYEYHDADKDRLSDIRHAAEELLQRALDLLDDRRFGTDYKYYRTARKAQAKGEYTKAIDNYKKIKGPILKQAAECYIPKCYELKKDTRNARSTYKKFINPESMGLYQGEAILSYVTWEYLQSRSKKELVPLYKLLTQSLDWFKRVEDDNEELDMSSIEGILEEYPSPDYLKDSGLGTLVKSKIGPRNIVNRKTCSWYLDELKFQTLLMHGFIASQVGEFKAMAKSFVAMDELNQAYGNRILADPENVKDRLITEGSKGSFLISPKAWSKLSTNNKSRLRLAAFQYIVGQLNQVEKLITVKKLAPYRGTDAEFNQFMQALLSFKKSDYTGAAERLKKFNTILKNSPIAPIAQFVRANCLASSTETYSEAIDQYERVHRTFKSSSFARRALLASAIMSTNHGKKDDALKACSDIMSRYPGTVYSRSASTLTTHVRNANRKKGEAAFGEVGISNSKEQKSRGGMVLAINTYLVIPKDKFVAEPTFNVLSDMYKYQIGLSKVSPCIRIKNFRLLFSEIEPVNIGVSTTHFSFLRSVGLIKFSKTF